MSAEVQTQDPRMAQLLELARSDPEVWFTTFARIKDKEGRLVRPKANAMQKRMFAYYRECSLLGIACLMVILKPRQKGASTCAQAIIYHHMRRHGGLNGALMGDVQSTSDKVFDIYRRYAENDTFPWGDSETAGLTPAQNGTDKIELPSSSTYSKETAGSKNAGRSGTVQVASLTEPAFYEASDKSDPTLAFLNSLNDASAVSLGIADSTPNGPKGWFYKTCRNKSASNRWKLIFAAWFEFEDSVKPFRTPADREEFERTMTKDELDELVRFGNDKATGAVVITPEHMHWRRDTIANKCDGDADKFKQEYPSDPIECFLKSARPRFDLQILEEMKQRAEGERVESVGNFSVQDDGRVTWLPDPAGQTRIFEGPKYGCRYWITFDTMTGEDQVVTGATVDPDWHDIQVWRGEYYDDGLRATRMRKLVCRHKSRLPVDIAATEAYGMGAYYGGCPIVVEKNNSGLAAIVTLRALGANLWKRRRINPTSNQVEEQLGWDTNIVTRKTIIDGFAKAIRERELDIPDVEVIEQCQTFVTNANGKPEAMPGEHDDAVLAGAIAEATKDCASERKMPTRPKWTQAKLRRDPGLGTSDGFQRTRFIRR